MTPDQQAFLGGFVARVSKVKAAPSEPIVSAQASAFLDEFVALVDRSHPVSNAQVLDTDLDAFRVHICNNWNDIIASAEGAIDTDLHLLRADQRALLRVFEESPSLLGPLSRARDEVLNTSLLAWFLQRRDPVGDACRRAILRRLSRAEAPHTGWTVTPESVIGSGRVDVEITIPGHVLIFIEAKIDAGERENQLSDYREHLDALAEERGCEAELVFLTVEGRSGEGDVEHERLAWRHILADWLPASRLGGPTATYLSAWLVSLAADLYGIAETGPFSTWSFSSRRRTLDLLRLVEVSDG